MAKTIASAKKKLIARVPHSFAVSVPLRLIKRSVAKTLPINTDTIIIASRLRLLIMV